MARIVVLSDIHLSPTHGFFWENWCAAREFADAAKADAVIVNGDLAINGPNSDAEIAFAATALGNLRTRVMALPGNHDMGDEPPGQDPDQIIDADRLARWNSSFATDRWALDAGSWRLVGVNAQLFGSGLAREQEQGQWLDEQLSTSGRPIALFLHKPLFLERSTDDVASPACMDAITFNPHPQDPKQIIVDSSRWTSLSAFSFDKLSTISLRSRLSCFRACRSRFRLYQWALVLKSLSNPDKHVHLIPSQVDHDFTFHATDRDHIGDLAEMPGAMRTAVAADGTEVYVKAKLVSAVQFLDGSPVIEALEEIKSQVARVLEAFKLDFERAPTRRGAHDSPL